MPALSQYQNVFRITKDPDSNVALPTRSSKRNRQSVSCLTCRSRKLKCDRQTPCSSCLKKGGSSSCTYTSDDTRERPKRKDGPKGTEVQLRLQRLEAMVTTLMERNQMNLNGPSDDSPVTLTPTETSSKVHENGNGNGSEISYVGATHWAAILDNIRDIQGVLGPDVPNPNDEENSQERLLPSNCEIDVLVNTAKPLTMDDFCKSLQARSEVDNLLSIYFNSDQFQKPVLHTRKFQREYEGFWTDPNSVSFLWVSMLFSIIYIGLQIKRIADKGKLSPFGDLGISTFLTRAGQALVAGEYQKAKPYSVEAVLLHAMCKFFFKDDPDTDAWMLIGVSTRLAFRMGYHRDSRHIPNISPFEGEMRRRTFLMVSNFDALLSFQAGLPSIIQEEECDSDPPRNLFDTDFDEYCTIIPESRPATYPTPMLYHCYKGRLGKTFRRITRYAHSLRDPPYEETMALDTELRGVHSDIPPSLKMKPIRASYMDPPMLILNRLHIDMLYLQCICVLHRRYLATERSNPRFAYSRRTCIDAALRTLDNQSQLFLESQEGGPFETYGRTSDSLSIHGSLTAAMITCLDLYECHKQAGALSHEDMETQVKKYDILKLCHEIWTSKMSRSREARRAAKVLAAMLSKVPRPHLPAPPPAANPQSSGNTINKIPDSYYDGLSWAANLSDGPESQLQSADPALNSIDPLSSVFMELDTLDWGLLDQYLIGWDGGEPSNAAVDWQITDVGQNSFA